MELKIGYAFQNIMKSNNKQKYSKKIQKKRKEMHKTQKSIVKEKKCIEDTLRPKHKIIKDKYFGHN